ncbi:hypothetical protein M0804_004299 [Polistes exclamans]|nr:hypothetical protein M0804_004299 [Polistes exclamans]
MPQKEKACFEDSSLIDIKHTHPAAIRYTMMCTYTNIAHEQRRHSLITCAFGPDLLVFSTKHYASAENACSILQEN